MKRSDIEKLVNEPVPVTVGGAGEREPKEVEIREPSRRKFREHLMIVVSAISQFLKTNENFLRRAFSESEKLTKEDVLAFNLPEAIDAIIADLVGEDMDYVNDEMTERQSTAVLSTYLDLIGMDYIHSCFSQALQGWKAAAQKMIAEAAPKMGTPPPPPAGLSSTPAQDSASPSSPPGTN